jgi:hypothetical protein
VDAYALSILDLALKEYLTAYQRVKGEVPPHAYIVTGLELRAALANDNVATNNRLAAIALNAKALRLAIAPISGAANALFVRHPTVPSLF